MDSDESPKLELAASRARLAELELTVAARAAAAVERAAAVAVAAARRCPLLPLPQLFPLPPRKVLNFPISSLCPLLFL